MMLLSSKQRQEESSPLGISSVTQGMVVILNAATLWERNEESLLTAESREIPHSFAKPQSFGMTVSALV